MPSSDQGPKPCTLDPGSLRAETGSKADEMGPLEAEDLRRAVVLKEFFSILRVQHVWFRG